MKTSNSNQVKAMRNVFRSLPHFWALTAAAFIALTTLTHAQFYVAQGASGIVGKVTTAGVPSTFATYPGGDAQGITTDSLGNVLVAIGTSIYQVTPGGSSSLYGTYTDPIGGLAMSSGGTLYGTKTSGGPSGGSDVGIYDALGTFTPLTLTNPGFAPFFRSNGLAFDGSGNLFIANRSNGGTYGESVLQLTPSGADWTISAFQSYATDTFKPWDIAFDPLGNVYVSSIRDTSTIAKYSAAGILDGTFTISGIGSNLLMSGVTFANEKLYAVALGTYKMYEIDPTTGAATDFLGAGNLPDYRSTFLTYTAVPEPSIMALVALGGLTLVGRRVSRKNGRACAETSV